MTPDIVREAGLSEDQRGPVVSDIEEGGPSWDGKLFAASGGGSPDVVLWVNGTRVHTRADFLRAIHEREGERGGHAQGREPEQRTADAGGAHPGPLARPRAVRQPDERPHPRALVVRGPGGYNPGTRKWRNWQTRRP